MKRAFLVSSLFCSALVIGCGDDKPMVMTATMPTTPATPAGEEDSGMGMSETGQPTSSSAGSTGGTSNGPTAPETDATSNTTPPDSETTPPETSTSMGPGGTDTGCMFICDSTGGMVAECNPFEAATDCPEGQKCMPYADDGGNSWNNNKCSPVTGDKLEGDTCTAEGSGVSGLDDCAAGYMCWDTDAENMGVCVQLCTGTPEAPMCDNQDKVCAIYNEGVLPICLDGCDPLAQDCDPSDVCIGNPSGDGFLCVLDASGDEGQQHDPCEYANACDPGLICLNSTAASECDPMSSGCCEPFCAVSQGDAQCMGMGQKCNPYYEMGMAPPGFEDVGYCAIPA